MSLLNILQNDFFTQMYAVCMSIHINLVKLEIEVLVAQSTLCNPMDCSPPGSSVHGILQARILEWVAMPFSRGSSWPRDWTCNLLHCRQILYHWATREARIYLFTPPCIKLFTTPWTVALQALLSMELSGQEYWSGLPFPSPGGLPNPGIEPTSSALAGGLPLSHQRNHILIFMVVKYILCA